MDTVCAWIPSRLSAPIATHSFPTIATNAEPLYSVIDCVCGGGNMSMTQCEYVYMHVLVRDCQVLAVKVKHTCIVLYYCNIIWSQYYSK